MHQDIPHGQPRNLFLAVFFTAGLVLLLCSASSTRSGAAWISARISGKHENQLGDADGQDHGFGDAAASNTTRYTV
jgi:hypothetical protein